MDSGWCLYVHKVTQVRDHDRIHDRSFRPRVSAVSRYGFSRPCIFFFGAPSCLTSSQCRHVLPRVLVSHDPMVLCGTGIAQPSTISLGGRFAFVFFALLISSNVWLFRRYIARTCISTVKYSLAQYVAVNYEQLQLLSFGLVLRIIASPTVKGEVIFSLLTDGQYYRKYAICLSDSCISVPVLTPKRNLNAISWIQPLGPQCWLGPNLLSWKIFGCYWWNTNSPSVQRENNLYDLQKTVATLPEISAQAS